MKKKLSFIIFMMLLLMPSYVKAACSVEDMSRLQKLASNVGFSYDYYESNGNVLFRVDIVNVTSDLKIRDLQKLKWYTSSDVIRVEGNLPGTSIMFSIYGASGSCDGEKLSTKYISLPYYNKYYKSSLCSDIPEFKLCQRWTNTSSISQTQFENSVKNYQKEEVPEEIVIPEEEIPLSEAIFNFILKYYYFLFGIPLIVAGFAIYRLNKNNSFDLE